MNRKTIIALLLALAMVLTLAACTKKEEPATNQQAAATPQTQTAQTQAPEETGPVTVDSVKALLEAIRPGATIMVKPGSYNITDFLSADLKNEFETWNAEHEYVKVQESADGSEFVVQGVDTLLISGGGDGPSETEFVVEPRYSSVFAFDNCQNVSLNALKLGHTEMGDCYGPVVYISACENVTMSAMDIYGCGVTGIECCQGTSGVSVYSSDIHDCVEGAIDIYNCTGEFYFKNCWIADSGGAGYINTENVSLTFEECNFGYWESDELIARDDITFTDCYWDPDVVGYDPDFPVFEPEKWEPWDGGEAYLIDTLWYAYCIVNPENGETIDLSYDSPEWFSLQFSENGAGVMTVGEDEVSFAWEMVDEFSGILTFQDDPTLYLTIYSDPTDDAAFVWLMIERDSELVWMY